MKNLLIISALFFLFSACDKQDASELLPTMKTTMSRQKTTVNINGVEISNFMYQIQSLDENNKIDLLAATNYDMLVVEPGFNFSESPYDVEYLVDNLKEKANGDKRLLLAYIDIGQAEDYRDYWQNDWVAPTENQVGSPDFLITIDPDGWSGNYPVAYWDNNWQKIWLEEGGLIEQIAEYGFDGVYLDWIEAYDDENIRDAASAQGKNTENEMLDFINKIKNTGKDIKSDFLVVAQNAPYLLDANPDYYTSIIDAVATEDTWFYGQGDADWNDTQAGDLQNGERQEDDYSTESRIAQSKKYLDYGIPVFTVDYCISEENTDFVYSQSLDNGFIPLVTRVSLSQITETPPPSLSNVNSELDVDNNNNNNETESIKITSISTDLDLYDDKIYSIDSDIKNINGSISIGGNTTLIIENATLNFDLSEDLEHGIYLEDNAKIIIRKATIESKNKMWEFELRNNASIEVSNSFLKNHSAVKLFDHCTLNAKHSLIEELRMDNQGVAILDDCEIYPNMQFFFNVGNPLEFPDSYTPVNFVLDNTAKNGWKLDMTNSVAQGWQVDVKPNTNIVIQNSIDVTLALWSNGSVNDSIHLVNPSGTATNFTITELGSNVSIINTEVYFMNLYLIKNDKLIISGEKNGTEYSTKFLEVLLVDDAELTIYDSHVFGQLFHTNNNAKVMLHNCLIGSDDKDDPINSELGVKDNAQVYAFDCDMFNTDIVIDGTSVLEVNDCDYDEGRVFISDNGELIEH